MRGSLAPVFVGTGPCHGDHEFAQALAAALTVPSYHVPDGALVEDLVAAVWGSQGFIGISLHGNITAFCFDKPHVALNLLDFSKLHDFGQLIERPAAIIRNPSELDSAFMHAEAVHDRVDILGRLQKRIDRHFDRIADIAAKIATSHRARSPAGNDELSTIARAYEIRGRRMTEERFALSEALLDSRARERELVAELDARIDQLAETEARREQDSHAIAQLRQRVNAVEAERNVLLESRSFRYTEPLRRLRRRLRSRVRRT